VRRFGRAVALVVVLLALTCCTPAQEGPRPQPDLATLIEAVTARAKADGTSIGSGSGRIAVQGAETQYTTQSATSWTPGGLELRMMRRETSLEGTTQESGILILPDAAYVVLPPGQPGANGKRYLLLDDAATDPVSMTNSQVVAEIKAGRSFCMTEAGRSEITDVRSEELDGRRVERYLLTIDLTVGSVAPAVTDFYRRLGLTTLHSTVDVDADDRLWRCAVDDELPGGSGRIWLEERADRFGGPLAIERPSADQVVEGPLPTVPDLFRRSGTSGP